MSYSFRLAPGKWIVVILSCLTFLAAGAATGQQQKPATGGTKGPQISSIFPAGAQRGTTTKFELKGKNLNAVSDIYFSHPIGVVENIEANGTDRLAATISIDADVEPGSVEVRLLSRDGISNLKLFRVDEFPEIRETSDKNDTPEQAQNIDFPAVVNGQLGSGDVDYYRIRVDRPQRIVFEIEARRLGSPVEARLRLLNRAGRLMADASTTRAIRPDERLDYEFLEPGEYIVAVEDAQYVGGDDAVYRLRVGSWPYATYQFPLGGRRGETVELTLGGGNLATPVKHQVSIATDPRLMALRPRFPTEQGSLVAPMQLAVGDEPDLYEIEPNDDLKQPQAIEVPCAVNGRIDRPGDKDRFLLKAKKGEKFAVEVFADRLGSWLDSVLTITDKNGRVIVENDDLRPGNAQQNPPTKTGLTPISDSRVEFSAQADGDFIITIDDRYNNGGPEFAYRLIVVPGRPDFQLAYGAAPATKNQPQPKNQPPATPIDVVQLEPGKSATIPVAVVRRGYDGEIELMVEDLPSDVTFEVGKIPAKQAAGQVTVKAGGDAPAYVGRARVIGTAKSGDQETRHFAQGEIVVSQIDAMHTAFMELSDVTLAVLRHEPPIALRTDGEAVLPRGLATDLKVAIDRKAGFRGPVEVRIDKLPKGVTAEKVTIPADGTECALALVSATNAAIGKQKVQVITQSRLGAAMVEISSEVSISIVMPFELTLDPTAKDLEFVAGESCSLKVGIKRAGNFQGPVELTVSGLPPGVRVTPDHAESEQDEVELVFDVPDDAKPSQSKKQLKIQATGEVGKEKTKVESGAIAISFKRRD